MPNMKRLKGLMTWLNPPADQCPNCGQPYYQCLNTRALCLPREWSVNHA